VNGSFIDWRIERTPYPQNLIIDIHSYCNARCAICPYPQLKDKLSMGKMDDHLFRRLIDEFAAVKAQHPIRGHVIFCNMGEVFIDPEAIEKLNVVRKAGLKMVLQTNAALLTPEKTDRLLDSGFDGPIYISFHGITKAVYENIMGLPYEKTLANIHYLTSKYPKVNIRAYAFQWPRGEAHKVKLYWRQHGVPVAIGIPNSRTNLVAATEGLPLKYPGPWLRGCKKGEPLRDMVISFDGQVVLCCEDMGRRSNLGNVRDKSLLEVWNGPQAQKVLDYLYREGWGKKEGFLCRGCQFGLSTQFRRFMKNLDNEWQRLTKTLF
jgi:radical SAM protein with 4Fe4S-binding SPASM domain